MKRDRARTDAPTGDALVRALERRFVTVVEDIPVGAEHFAILRPRSPEDLISEADFERDERLPYWADVWPSARVLAARLLAAPGAGKRLLELGCGSGVVAVAALRAGYDVTATDYYDDALLFTRANAWRLVGREPESRMVDWRDFPNDLGWFDVVVASDVLYERPHAELVARALARTLARGGLGIVTDPGRLAAPAFVDAVRSLGMGVDERGPFEVPVGKTVQQIRMYEVRKG